MLNGVNERVGTAGPAAQWRRPRGGWWRAGTEGNGKLRKARAKLSLLARSKMQAEEGAANCEGQSIGKRKVVLKKHSDYVVVGTTCDKIRTSAIQLALGQPANLNKST